jgi:UDP-glucose 4-epimerase
MKRVFVTGAAGLIGMTLMRRLCESGYEVIGFDLAEQLIRRERELNVLRERFGVKMIAGTIMDRFAITAAAAGTGAVVHLAAMLGVQRTEDNRLRCLDININGTDNVLSACVHNRISHVVIASSSEVYGEPSSNPIPETAETKGKTVYAVSKLAAEELVRGYHQIALDLDYTIVRFFNTYGEGQVAQFVLSRFVKRVLEGKNPIVYGDGNQTRSYCHVTDAVEGLKLILESPGARNKLYNIGNSNEIYTLKQAAQKVISVLAPARQLAIDTVDFDQSDRTKQREIFSRYCDNRKAREELGFSPKVTLDEGIRRIAQAGIIEDDWAHKF